MHGQMTSGSDLITTWLAHPSGSRRPGAPAVLRAPVRLDRAPRAAPDAVGTLKRIETPSLRRLTQRCDREVLVDEGGQRDKSRGAGEVGNDEAVEVVPVSYTHLTLP